MQLEAWSSRLRKQLQAFSSQKQELSAAWKRRSHQVSLVVFHPGGPDEVVLLAPPVTEATEEVVGEEPVDGVPDYVDVDGLLYPEPYKDRSKSKLRLWISKR